jgi:hypothetical protein
MPYRGYASVFNTTQPIIATGRTYGYSLYNGSTSVPATFATPELTIDPTLITGFAVNFNYTTYSFTLAYYDGATLGISIVINPSNPSTIQVYLGESLISTYSDFTFAQATWYYLETKVFCHATSGTIEVRINNTTVISLIGINTKAGADAYYNQIYYTLPAHGYVDDLYICDGSGSAQYNFLGPCCVLGILPSADTATIDWIPSTGATHYNLVNIDYSGATYVKSSISGDEDLYTYPALTNPETIIALQINSAAAMDADGTSAIIESPITSDSVTDYGTDTTVSSTTYNDARHISTTDPSTGLPWTLAGLAAAQIGIKVM